jgi:hypothetical protein
MKLIMQNISNKLGIEETDAILLVAGLCWLIFAFILFCINGRIDIL